MNEEFLLRLFFSALVFILSTNGLFTFLKYENDAHPKKIEIKKEINFSNVQLPIFMYHYIRDYKNPNDILGENLSVSPQNFASQLDKIQSKGFETVTFNDVLYGSLNEKSAILTFDDGYEDFYLNAFPELKKRNMKAVVFVITDFIGRPGYLTESEIKELTEYGIEIGSHTKSHPNLASISLKVEISQIDESKAILEKITGQKIISFCYPFGKYSLTSEKTVEVGKFRFAVTTANGIGSFKNPLKLSRYRVYNNSDVGYFLS